MGRWYTATLLSLIVHQIDAAYWHAWEMFDVPGGIQGFRCSTAIGKSRPARHKRGVMPCSAAALVCSLPRSTPALPLQDKSSSVCRHPS